MSQTAQKIPLTEIRKRVDEEFSRKFDGEKARIAKVRQLSRNGDLGTAIMEFRVHLSAIGRDESVFDRGFEFKNAAKLAHACGLGRDAEGEAWLKAYDSFVSAAEKSPLSNKGGWYDAAAETAKAAGLGDERIRKSAELSYKYWIAWAGSFKGDGWAYERAANSAKNYGLDGGLAKRADELAQEARRTHDAEIPSEPVVQ